MEQFLREAIVLVVGKQAEPLAELLDSKTHVNEFIIAKKLDTTINHARNLLYKLSEFGLVSSIRKKDKKKGWYTYFWKLEQGKVLLFLKDILTKKIAELSEETNKRETGRYYVCDTCKLELDEEKSLLQDFTCSECGKILTEKDNSRDIKELLKLRERYAKELELINQELASESVKNEKKKVKDNIKKEKEIVKKKAIAKKERADKRLAEKKASDKSKKVKKSKK